MIHTFSPSFASDWQARGVHYVRDASEATGHGRMLPPAS